MLATQSGFLRGLILSLVLFPAAAQSPAAICEGAKTTEGACGILCAELSAMKILPNFNVVTCMAKCSNSGLGDLSTVCRESLCEWGLESTALSLLNPEVEMRLLEAYFSSTQTLAAVVLTTKSILSLGATKGSKGWGAFSYLGGHLKNYGSYDGCNAIGGAHYCSTKISVANNIGYGPFAVCVPQTCSVADVNAIFNATQYSVANYLVNFTKTLSPNTSISVSQLVYPQETLCGDNSYPLDSNAITMIVVMSILGAAVVGASVYVYINATCRSTNREEEEDGEETIENSKFSSITEYATGGKGDSEYNFDDENSYGGYVSEAKEDQSMSQPINSMKRENPPVGRTASDTTSIWTKILTSISLTSSYTSFITLRKSTGTEAMDGVRVFSMLWVIFGHTYLWPFIGRNLPGYSNLTSIVPFDDSKDAFMSTWEGQVLPSAEFSVDTFFFMSGFLAAYVSLKKFRGKEPRDAVMSAPYLYLHRWLRLTPVYMLIIWFYTYIIPQTMKGPFFNMSGEIQACQENWYYNFLYVQTVFPDKPERAGCYGVSWYLADDMMFFWATPWLLAVFLWNKVIGVLFPLLLCVGSITAAWIVAWKKQLRVGTFDSSPYHDFYYNPPWMRAPAYLIGVILGMGYFEWRQRKLSIPKEYRFHVQNLMAIVVAVLFGSTVWGAQKANDGIPSSMSYSDNNAYIALSKPAWSIGVGMMLLMCFEGLGGPVGWLLSRPLFSYIAKLTFLMYLLHPMVLALMFFNKLTPIHYSAVNFSFNYIAAVFATMAIAFLAHLFVELPLAALQTLLMAKLFGREMGGGGSKKAATAKKGMFMSTERKGEYRQIGGDNGEVEEGK